MGERNRPIDAEIEGLDNGLFPPWSHLHAVPLIQVAPGDPPPASTITDPPPAYTITGPPPAYTITDPPPAYTIAGLVGGVLFTGLCALALSRGGLPMPPPATGASAQEAVDDARLPEVDAFPAAMPRIAMSATPLPEVEAPATPSAPAIAAAPHKLPRAGAATAAPVYPIAVIALPPASAVPDESAILGALPTGVDPSSAAVALAAAGRRAAGCAGPGDKPASIPVSVTFARSGRVTVARVEGGSFYATEVGRCIARALRSATVREFAGSPVTIHGAIRLP